MKWICYSILKNLLFSMITDSLAVYRHRNQDNTFSVQDLWLKNNINPGHSVYAKPRSNRDLTITRASGRPCMDHLINIYRPATINRKRSSQLPRVHHDLDPADPIRDRIAWSPTSVFYRRSPNVQSRAAVRFWVRWYWQRLAGDRGVEFGWFYLAPGSIGSIF